MNNNKLTICDAVIHPGETANLAMPLPEQFSCSPLYMPIKIIHGKQQGPCLVLFSVLQGSELNGLEIANRVVDLAQNSHIKGTIIAIPVVNVYGLVHYPAMLPSGNRLADCFPGAQQGTFGERLAYLFTHEILKKADYCIELQTGALNHNILPQVYCNFDNLQAKQLAKAFQSPVITNVPLAGNCLRQTTEELQIPLLVYQAGEAMRFDENAIALGVKGVANVMRAIDILPKSPAAEINPIFSQDEDWIAAHKGGILHTSVTLGQMIKQGEVIGKIADPFGTDFSENVRAPQEGIVVGINTTPLIHEGLPIFKVASFLDYDRAENVLEQWDKKQPDSYMS
ncbi:MAG: succinylglutamate desuccinylase/aspartoacylase family protein [Myxococcota bacterium]